MRSVSWRGHLTCALLLLASFRTLAAGAQEPKVTVYVSHSGNDDVGAKLAYAVREELRRSANFVVSAPDRYEYRVTLTTIDITPPSLGRNVISAVGVVFSTEGPRARGAVSSTGARRLDLLIGSNVAQVGIDGVESIARRIVSELDELVVRHGR